MTAEQFVTGRRRFAKRLLAAGTGLVLATTLPAAPGHAEHAAAASGHMWGCGSPYGPLHQFLYATAPDPVWQDVVIWRESNWQPGVTNRYSGAAGLAQFMPGTWEWGGERFGIYGSPYDAYQAIRMMNAFIAAGEYSHWSETGYGLQRRLAARN